MIDIPADLSPNSAFVKYIPDSKAHHFGTIDVYNHGNVHGFFISNFFKETNSSLEAKLDSMQEKAMKNLSAYRNLQNGWDLYDAKPINPKAIQIGISYVQDTIASAKSLFLELIKLSVGPGADGTIGIEIQTSNKTVLIDIDAGDDEISLHKIDQKNEIEQAYSTNQLNMGEVLAWMAS